MKTSSSGKSAGFSLVEILPAIVVLAILGFIIAQVTSATSRTTRFSNRVVDTASEARQVFGTLSVDLAGWVKRPDAPVDAQNRASGGGPILRLVTAVPTASATYGSGVNRGVSVVAYQVAPHGDNAGRPCLTRAGKAVAWTSNGYFGLDAKGLPLTFSSATFPAAFLPQEADFDILAPGVLRMVVGFELYPDNQPATLADGTTIANARGQLVYSPPLLTVAAYGGSGNGTEKVVDLSRIGSLVVGLVVVGSDSLQQLSAEQATVLGAAFPVPSSGTFPVPAWGKLADAPLGLPAVVPLAVRQSVRVFQCAYPVTLYASRP